MFANNINSINRHQKAQGFTLLEILIALFIFMIIAITTTFILKSVITTNDRIKKHLDILHQLQITYALMQQDIMQTTERAVQRQNEQTQPAFLGEKNQITFTRAGYVNPLTTPFCTLQRIRYRFEGNHLFRETWPYLDSIYSSPTKSKKILDNIVDLQFNFLDKKNNFIENWLSENNSVLNFVPRAIIIKIKFKNHDEISWLFPTKTSVFLEAADNAHNN